MAGSSSARRFHRQNGRCAFQERDDHDSQHLEICTLLIGSLGHVRSHRSDQPVTQKNSEKCAHQCRRHFAPNLLGWPPEGLHRDYDPEHGCHNAKSWQRVCHRSQRSHWLGRIMVKNFHVKLDQLVKFESLHSADCHAHAVAKKIAHVSALQEIRVLRKNLALIRLFDV